MYLLHIKKIVKGLKKTGRDLSDEIQNIQTPL